MTIARRTICIMLCMLIIFCCTVLPIWQSEVYAAAAITSTVIAICGIFVTSAGFYFLSQADFQAAITEFLRSSGAAYLAYLETVAGTYVSGVINLFQLVNSPIFVEFWQAILDFFGRGEVEVETELPAVTSDFAYYNGVYLPNIDSVWTDKVTYPYAYLINVYGDYRIYLTSTQGVSNASGWVTFPNGGSFLFYLAEESGWGTKTPGSVSSLGFGDLIWCSADTFYSDGTVYLAASEPVYEGGETVTDVIGVYEKEDYVVSDVYNGWIEKAGTAAAEGTDAIDYVLDGSAIYQDATSTDTEAAQTATQSGVLSEAGVSAATISESTSDYKVTGLTGVFPFCIPFDIYNFLTCLTAEREAPVFDFNLNFGDLGQHNISVDLSGWETVAQILRTIELLGFCVGLAFVTSKIIKW